MEWDCSNVIFKLQFSSNVHMIESSHEITAALMFTEADSSAFHVENKITNI